ncbi:MAG: cbb3-type cytochrome c oxidase subunit I [Planctomycetota bacterium]|jgi:cytochrome c oxidase cbb3-type subunit 1
MSKVTVWFIKCAMVYLVIATLLGIHMAASGPMYPYMPLHAHLNLLGWMSMMIFGVAYHILPRFSGTPLWSERLSVWHLWLANIGLVGMTLGWVNMGLGKGSSVLTVFSIVQGVSIALFVVNMFKTIRTAPTRG